MTLPSNYAGKQPSTLSLTWGILQLASLLAANVMARLIFQPLLAEVGQLKLHLVLSACYLIVAAYTSLLIWLGATYPKARMPSALPGVG